MNVVEYVPGTSDGFDELEEELAGAVIVPLAAAASPTSSYWTTGTLSLVMAVGTWEGAGVSLVPPGLEAIKNTYTHNTHITWWNVRKTSKITCTQVDAWIMPSSPVNSDAKRNFSFCPTGSTLQTSCTFSGYMQWQQNTLTYTFAARDGLKERYIICIYVDWYVHDAPVIRHAIDCTPLGNEHLCP